MKLSRKRDALCRRDCHFGVGVRSHDPVAPCNDDGGKFPVPAGTDALVNVHHVAQWCKLDINPVPFEGPRIVRRDGAVDLVSAADYGSGDATDRGFGGCCRIYRRKRIQKATKSSSVRWERVSTKNRDCRP